VRLHKSIPFHNNRDRFKINEMKVICNLNDENNGEHHELLIYAWRTAMQIVYTFSVLET
jgi:hypothetical protein